MNENTVVYKISKYKSILFCFIFIHEDECNEWMRDATNAIKKVVLLISSSKCYIRQSEWLLLIF